MGGPARDRFGIGQVDLDALHDFGKGQVTRSIVGNDVD